MRLTTTRYWSLLSVCYISTASSIGLASSPNHILIAQNNHTDKYGKTETAHDDWQKIYNEALQQLNVESTQRERGIYSQYDAHPYLKRALEAAQKFGEENPKVADVLMLEGKWRELIGNVTTEEYAKALSIREKAYGTDSPKVAEALNGLGEMYVWRQKYAEATACFYRSLSIMEHNQGKGSLSLAQSLNKACERGLARAGDTKRLLLKVLHSIEQSPSHNQMAIAQILNTITYTAQRNTYPPVPMTEQVDAAKRAIAIQERIAGITDLSLANYLESLARLYAEQGQWIEAINTYRRVISIREKGAAANSCLLSRSYDKMAEYLRSSNNIDEAEKYKKLSLAVWQRAPGDSYTNMINALNSIAYFYENIGKLDKAAPYYQEVDIIETRHNPRQSHSTEKLAKLYMQTGRYSEAEPLLKRCVTLRSSGNKGHSHNYDCISYLEMLGIAATKQGKYTDAKSCFDQVKEYYDQSKYAFLGDKYPKGFLEAYIEYLQKSGQQTEYLAYKARLEKLLQREQHTCPACGMG